MKEEGFFFKLLISNSAFMRSFLQWSFLNDFIYSLIIFFELLLLNEYFYWPLGYSIIGNPELQPIWRIFFDLGYYLTSAQSLRAILVAFSVCIALNILSLILSVITSTIKNSKVKLLIRIMSSWVFLFTKIGCIPLLSLSINIFVSLIIANFSNSYYISISQGLYDPLFGYRNLLIGFSITFAVQTILISILAIGVQNDNRIHSNTIASGRNSERDFIFFISRMSICIHAGCRNYYITLIAMIIVLMNSILILIRSFNLESFAKSNIISFVRYLVNSTILFSSLINLFYGFLGYQFSGFEQILYLIIIISTSVLLLLNKINQIEESKITNIFDEKNYQTFLIKLYLKMNNFFVVTRWNSREKSKMLIHNLLNFIIQSPTETSLESKTVIKELVGHNIKFDGPFSAQQEEEFVNKAAHILIECSKKRFATESEIFVFSSYYYNKFDNNLWKSYLELEKAEKLAKNFSETNCILIERNELEESFIQLSSSSQLNISNVIKYNVQYQNLLNLEKDFCALSIECWSQLISSSLDPNLFFNQTKKMSNQFYKIKDSYNDLSKIAINNPDFFYSFAKFLCFCLSSFDESKSNLIKSQEISKKIEYWIVGKEEMKGDFSSILVSGCEKDLGTILNCSPNVYSLTGYGVHELVGNHMNLLLPKFFEKSHNLYFEGFFSAKTIFVNNNIFTSVIKAKNGNFVLVKIQICYSHNLENGISFLVFISKEELINVMKLDRTNSNLSQTGFFVIDVNGCIRGCSEVISDQLGIFPNIFFSKNEQDEDLIHISSLNKILDDKAWQVSTQSKGGDFIYIDLTTFVEKASISVIESIENDINKSKTAFNKRYINRTIFSKKEKKSMPKSIYVS